MSDEYRSIDEANALLPLARAVLEDVQSRLPAGVFEINWPTLFIGCSVPEEVACVAVSLIGKKQALTALEFELNQSVGNIVDRLMRWRDQYGS